MFSLLTFAWVGPLMRLGYRCAAHARMCTRLSQFLSHLKLFGVSTKGTHTVADRDALRVDLVVCRATGTHKTSSVTAAALFVEDCLVLGE